jgi:hypothetical protein
MGEIRGQMGRPLFLAPQSREKTGVGSACPHVPPTFPLSPRFLSLRLVSVARNGTV